MPQPTHQPRNLQSAFRFAAYACAHVVSDDDPFTASTHVRDVARSLEAALRLTQSGWNTREIAEDLPGVSAVALMSIVSEPGAKVVLEAAIDEHGQSDLRKVMRADRLVVVALSAEGRANFFQTIAWGGSELLPFSWDAVADGKATERLVLSNVSYVTP